MSASTSAPGFVLATPKHRGCAAPSELDALWKALIGNKPRDDRAWLFHLASRTELARALLERCADERARVVQRWADEGVAIDEIAERLGMSERKTRDLIARHSAGPQTACRNL